MSYKALIPVKALSEAKSRLAPYLTQSQRKTLVLDMLRHVLCVLHQSNLLGTISVVSADHEVLQQARTWGAQALIEATPGHNPALQAAACGLTTGTTGLLTISSDLPLLSADDIRGMIKASLEYPVVLAPSQEGTGTNAILLRPPLALPYLFGPNSLRQYQEAARQKNLELALYHSPGLAFDVDTIEDLHTLRCPISTR